MLTVPSLRSPLYLLVALLLALSIAVSDAFPARFVHGLSTRPSALTLTLSSPAENYSCKANLGAVCTLGNFTILPNVTATVTDGTGAVVVSQDLAELNQTTGTTYVLYTSSSNTTQLTGVIDALPPVTSSVSMTFGNFFANVEKVATPQGEVYLNKLPVGEYSSNILSFFPVGKSQVVFEISKSTQAYTFNVAAVGNAAYTSLFLAGLKANNPTLLTFATWIGPAPTDAPGPHGHHHLWVPIVAAVSAFAGLAIIGVIVWCACKRNRDNYQTI